MKIYTGTSGFANKEWKGKFYPEKIPPKEMLRFYAEHFRHRGDQQYLLSHAYGKRPYILGRTGAA